MIKAIIGGVGSGKTISMTKMLIDLKQLTFSNFNINAPFVERLLKDNIISKRVETNDKGKEKEVAFINWGFWNSIGKPFNLAFDEIHNVLHSRQSMTKWNTLMSIWVSQIRKILDSDEKHHLYLISQKLDRIDVALRDLIHTVTFCECYVQMRVGNTWRTVPKNIYKEKYQDFYPLRQIPTEVMINGKLEKRLCDVTWIKQTIFRGDKALMMFDRWAYGNEKTYDKRTCFLGNPYFKYYNSYELITFGDDVYV